MNRFTVQSPGLVSNSSDFKGRFVYLFFYQKEMMDYLPICLWMVLLMTSICQAQDMLQQAAGVRPHPRQYEWQKLEFTCFIHFGPNTFTGREWGTGMEDPRSFNPTSLDAEQWVRTAQSAGARMIVLVAKHHDGFCMWPSRYSDHTVRESPYKNGKGDIVKELVDACRKHGLKVGIYLSPADLNAIHQGFYGKTEKKQRTIPTPVEGWTPRSDFRMKGEYDEYNTYFMNQLFETLTEYGPFHEIWFDGANPKPGTGQEYAHQDWYKLIRALAPDACIFGKGPDIRWVGNESGGSRDAEWSVVPIPAPAETYTWDDMTGADLGSRARLKNARYLHWYPAETDVPIRHGWFYRDEQQKSRNVGELLDIYYRSVGGNSVLLLNLSPDRRGLIPDRDVKTMSELGDILRATFAENLAGAATVQVNAAREGFPIEHVLDGKEDTYWMTPEGVESAEVTLTLPEARTFNIVSLQEAILQQGQRVEKFAVEIWQDSGWKQIGHGQTIGYRKFVVLSDPVTTDRVRIRFIESRFAISLKSLELFYQTPRGKSGAKIDLAGAEMKKQWKVIDASSFEPGFEPEKAIDGNPDTYWHTEYRQNKPHPPHWIAIDFGSRQKFKGLSYLPRQDATGPHIFKYEVYLSDNGVDWNEPIVQGEFGNIVNNPIEQQILFGKTVQARYIKFVSIEPPPGSVEASIAEMDIIGE